MAVDCSSGGAVLIAIAGTDATGGTTGVAIGTAGG